jgi:hypothetical protein
MVEIRRLIWDPLNVEHIGRHRVSPREVEEVCHVDPLVQQGKLGRIAIVGPTAAGRVLVAVLDPQADGAFYVVTARPASRKDRALYWQEKGGEST